MTAPDHPRSRGVYARAEVDKLKSHGSSPLARGLPVRAVQPRLVDGIIPARAGFTYIDKWMDVKSTDHPRSRGVYAA